MNKTVNIRGTRGLDTKVNRGKTGFQMWWCKFAASCRTWSLPHRATVTKTELSHCLCVGDPPYIFSTRATCGFFLFALAFFGPVKRTFGPNRRIILSFCNRTVCVCVLGFGPIKVAGPLNGLNRIRLYFAQITCFCIPCSKQFLSLLYIISFILFFLLSEYFCLL